MAYVNDTGLPSVTTIIGQYIDSQWFTDESRERGSAVHAACHAHIIGAYVVPLPVAWRGYFDSFRIWVDAARPVVDLAEVRLTDDQLGFCGQPDFVGAVGIRDGRGLIDYKTSISLEKWFRLQGAAYRHLAGRAGFQTQWGGTLRLKADGSMPLLDFWPDNVVNDFSRFLMSFNLFKFFGKGEK